MQIILSKRDGKGPLNSVPENAKLSKSSYRFTGPPHSENNVMNLMTIITLYRPCMSLTWEKGKWWQSCCSCLYPPYPIKGSQEKFFKSCKQTEVNYFYRKAELSLIASL